MKETSKADQLFFNMPCRLKWRLEMAIENKEFKFEEDRLCYTNEWLRKQLLIIDKNNSVLKDKIGLLKKEARGRYNEELEIAEKLHLVSSKSLHKYTEAAIKPYFARIDFRELRREIECFYIGKFGIGDISSGDEIVIDWRAPIADLYYSGTEGKTYFEAPAGLINGILSLKRKFIIKDGELKDAFDEGINEIILKSTVAEDDGNALIDEYLRINLEESISGKLKDVVATIQREQNEIIRAEKNSPLIVQGSAGSGKTTIALHRLAYLLYKYKNRLSGKDILVIAPNKIFLDYISELLPNLGVEEVKQKTFEEIALEILDIKGKIITKDKKLSQVLEGENENSVKYITTASKLKGTSGYKLIMDRFIRYLEKADAKVLDIKVEDYIIFEEKEIRRLFVVDLIKFPLNKRKDEIKRYFKLKLNDKISNILSRVDFNYESLIARIKKSMEDGSERRIKLTEIYDERDLKKKQIKGDAVKAFDNYFVKWKHGSNIDLYSYLFNNEEIFKEATDNKIPEKLANYIRECINNNLLNNIIDSDDIAAMLYLKFKIDDVPEKYKFKHLVVDEAQDYSIFQLLVMRLMTTNNSFTMVGDVGQGIYFYKGIDSWEKVIQEAFEGEGRFISLTQSYRSTVEIISFANKVLLKQLNSLKPAEPVLRHGKLPEIISYESNREFSEKLDTIVNGIINSGKTSVAVIGKTLNECKIIKEALKKWSKFQWEVVKDTDKKLKLERLIIPSYMTKGLEFDCSVIYNCSDKNYKDNELDKKILYVALTRALHEEYIFYNGELTNLLV